MYLVITRVVYELTTNFYDILQRSGRTSGEYSLTKTLSKVIGKNGAEGEQVHMESKKGQIYFRNFLFFSLTAEVTSILFTSTFQENL